MNFVFYNKFTKKFNTVGGASAKSYSDAEIQAVQGTCVFYEGAYKEVCD